MKKFFLLIFIIFPLFLFAQKQNLKTEAAKRADALTEKVVGWRRDFHEHPELGNLETRTAGIVAAHLKSLGIEVKTGVAKTGVVGIL